MVGILLFSLLLSHLAAAQSCGFYPADYQSGDWVCMAPGRSMAICFLEGLGRPGGVYHLQVQGDENLVIYRTADMRPIWATNTPNNKAQFRDTSFFYSADGNTGIFSGGIVVNVPSQKLGNTWGTNGLLCLNVANGALTLFNAGQSSLTNPVWTSVANNGAGGFVLSGYPSSPTKPGPAAIIPAPPPPPPAPSNNGEVGGTAPGLPTEDFPAITSITAVVEPLQTTVAATSVATISTDTSNKAIIAPPSAPENNSTTPKQSNGLGIGPIAGISGGVLLAFIGLGYFVYRSRKRNKSFTNEKDTNKNNTYSMAEMQKNPYTEIPPEKRDPVPQYIDYATSPEYAGKGSATYSVTAVPAFYRAIVDHEPLKHGQLRLKTDMRVYVTAVDKNGWCKALAGREEGYVHANMLATLG